MANRIVRDFTNSDKIDKLSSDAERFFVRLMMKADDFGSFFSNIKQLRAHCFPLKSFTDKYVEKLFKELLDAGLVFVYTVENKEYVRIIGFNQTLRRMKRQFPEPLENVGQMSDKCPQNVRLKRNESETKRNETETKANVGQMSSAGIDEVFEIDYLLEKYSVDEKWIEDSAYSLSCEILRVRDLLQKFKKHLGTQKIYTKTETDFRTHFMNWARKQKNNNGKNSSNSERPRLAATGGFGKL